MVCEYFSVCVSMYLAKATWIQVNYYQSMVFIEKKIEENKCSKNTEPISARIADNVALIM